ncbi:efflux RND transporter permease subunit, partial [Escherichia sp. SS-MK2]
MLDFFQRGANGGGAILGNLQDVRNAGMTNAKPAILLMIRKLPEANIIQTVDSIRAKLPELQETIPALRTSCTESVTVAT